ncbi:MAG: isochorismatase family protein [Acetobacteraceae bacterium]|jgi:nicotinamidase-related amidase
MSIPQAPGSRDGLSPDNTVLVLIDHQLGMMSIIRDMSLQDVRNNVLGLAQSAKTLGVPVVLTSNMEWGINGRIMPELRRIFADQPVIGRPGVINAWRWPALREAVVQTGRRNVIMAGVTTSTGLQFAALDMLRDGYDVHAVIDASGAESAVARDVSVATLTHAGVKARTWFSVAAELLGDWQRDIDQGSPLGFGAMHDHLTAWGYLLDKAIDQVGSEV